MTESRLLKGVGVAPGIKIGTARVVHWELPTVTRSFVTADEVPGEIERLRESLAAVHVLLEDLRVRTRERAGAEESKIFDAQILMLQDPEFLREVEILIRDNHLSAERAFEFKTLEMRAMWAQSSSFQLRQRVADLSGIQVRVLNHLMGRSVGDEIPRIEETPTIVFTRELTPGLTVQLEREDVAGLASAEGARTAHAAILARSLGIPCVMGVIEGFDRIQDGMTVILDGTHGIVLLTPTAEEVAAAEATERLRVELDRKLEEVVGLPAVTLDGRRVALRGNVDLPEELDGTVHHGGEGVGLLRTEFLVLGRTDLPTEDEQASYFEHVAKSFPGHPVVVRTYDLGGDKFPAAFRTAPEANPYLGWRAIRVCLDHPELFRAQIRAALRARLHGDVRLLIPMVTQLEEITYTQELVAESARQLERDGIPAAGSIPLGVMIETPAAAILVDQFANRCDFMSIGTNDLTQYTLALDRGNARLADRFTPHSPAVLQLLERIADGAARSGVEVSVCGEMASDPISTFLLLGLGYRVLSVSPPSLPLVRWIIRQVDVDGAAAAANAALLAPTKDEAEAILERGLAEFVDVELVKGGRLPTMVGSARLRSFSTGRL